MPPVPSWRAMIVSGASTHAAVPSNDTSTTLGSPVCSRPNSAAAIPPASVIAPMESPNAAR
jgi:hypothetical protein